MQGPVLQPFSYDEAHPYAAGQHRGVDIGADAAGEPVVAPAAGTVSFAGTVPTNGKSVTIETADGYSVTLTHLGSIAVAKGATVAEQDADRHDRPERHARGGRAVRPPRDSHRPPIRTATSIRSGLLPPAAERRRNGDRHDRIAAGLERRSLGCPREQAGVRGAERRGRPAPERVLPVGATFGPPAGARAEAARGRSDDSGAAPSRGPRSRERADASSLGGRSSSRWRPGRSVSTPATRSRPSASRRVAATRALQPAARARLQLGRSAVRARRGACRATATRDRARRSTVQRPASCGLRARRKLGSRAGRVVARA